MVPISFKETTVGWNHQRLQFWYWQKSVFLFYVSTFQKENYFFLHPEINWNYQIRQLSFPRLTWGDFNVDISLQKIHDIKIAIQRYIIHKLMWHDITTTHHSHNSLAENQVWIEYVKDWFGSYWTATICTPTGCAWHDRYKKQTCGHWSNSKHTRIYIP